MGIISDNLRDKVCVVTGAAKSIGFGIAAKYAASGAKAILLDVSPEVETSAKRLADAGWSARGYVFDVTDRDAVFDCFGKIVAEFGDIHALVNNAGVVDQRPFEETGPEVFERMFKVNVYGSAYCIQAALPSMKRNRDGRIVNFSSKSGKTGSALMAPYSAAKGAVIALTQSLAFEFAPFNIKINAVCPGITGDTGVWDSVSSGYIHNLKLPRGEVIKKFTAKVPLARLAAIEDVVDFVFFLTVSGEYCTGQAFNITGGREMH
ncbi:MAG: SDR family oxidoreductase [Planctomycetota bacterium]|jgi:NAD(P)-dependent dehydrogenase (short-subunit alcohol dehydrogenase family)|nr:SDR family oxidoreductase [Planctomycetota bacterium]